MSNSIRLLPDTVANQIAAGEVVNRPASVVKEMMENAIDAQASEVTVNFVDGGKELIQIIDNGKGMSSADARMAFERHATSKIQKVEDIYALSTFGFRGEALASIAAVAEVTLCTKREEDSLATEVTIAGGKFKDQEMTQGEVGSQFLVKNLFYNVPARRRFLDKSTTEARHITAEFQRVALCNADKSFALYNDNAPLFKLEASTLKKRIVQLTNKNMANNLLEIKADTTIIKIEGFVGSPSSSKQHNKDQYLFINNRYFKSTYFHKAILQAYEKLIPVASQPSYFVYLTIDPERIDVNVHPQKTEVKFDDNSAIWQIINAATREALAKTGAVPMMDFDDQDKVEIPIFKKDAMVYKEPTVSLNPSFNPFKESSFDAPSEVLEQNFEQMIMEYIDGEDSGAPSEQSSIKFDHDTIIGDILPLEKGKYFATTINYVLTLINIKRAYSCVLYERYKTMLNNGSSASQQLMFPITFSLSPQQKCSAEIFMGELSSFGFDFNIKDDMVEFLGIPADFTDCNTEEVFCSLLETLQEEQGTAPEFRQDFLAKAMAKTSALRSVENSALKVLLEELLSCEYVNYTPDGLAVMSQMSENDIFRKFEN